MRDVSSKRIKSKKILWKYKIINNKEKDNKKNHKKSQPFSERFSTVTQQKEKYMLFFAAIILLVVTTVALFVLDFKKWVGPRALSCLFSSVLLFY